MSRGQKEFLTGIAVGLAFGILVFGKLAFGAELSNEDIDMINRVVEAEAGNQPLQGRRYVVSVVLNRIDDPTFPDTASGVIAQPHQFSTYDNLENVTPSWRSELATKMEIENRSDYEITFFRAGHFGYGSPKFQYKDHFFSTLEK